jgi:hypothetical protein
VDGHGREDVVRYQHEEFVLSQLGKKQRLSLKGPVTVTGMPNVAFHGGNIRGTILSELPSSVSSSYFSPPWLGAVKIFSPTILRLLHHIPLTTAPSLRWSLAMGLIYSKTIIYISSLRQI